MEVLYLTIGISVIIAGGFLIAFSWAVYNGQYDDRVTQRMMKTMLFSFFDATTRKR
jgi:cbb3-type cytochrome oxidase maturation protein